jgi:Tfp pilus assembly protein PilF
MLELARVGRILTRAGAVLFLTVILTWVLPLIPGVDANRSFLVNVLTASAFVVFEIAMYKGAAAIPRLILYFVLGTVVFIAGAKASESAGLCQWLKKAATNRLLPYPIAVLLAILLRLAIGVVFVTIVSAWAANLISAKDLTLIAAAGVLLALASCFWPLILVALMAIVYACLFLPVLFGVVGLGRICAIDKLLNQEQQKKLGFALGQGMAFGVMFLAWGLVCFQSNFPVNWEKLPPHKVPEGLTAKKYYELAIQYKHMGWTEQARDSLNKAIGIEPEGEYSERARRYLQTKLPRQPVAKEAEQRNIQGFNQMFGGDIKAAKQTFKELIAEYPNFEWPYSNLASIYLQEKQLQQAKELLDRALEINPYYVNAWRHLSEVYKLMGKEELVSECTTKIAELDTDDELSELTQR